MCLKWTWLLSTNTLHQRQWNWDQGDCYKETEGVKRALSSVFHKWRTEERNKTMSSPVPDSCLLTHTAVCGSTNNLKGSQKGLPKLRKSTSASTFCYWLDGFKPLEGIDCNSNANFEKKSKGRCKCMEPQDQDRMKCNCCAHCIEVALPYKYHAFLRWMNF